MGLAYFFLFLLIFGAGMLAFIFLRETWKIWKRPQRKLVAVIFLLLTIFFAAAAFYLLAIVWREPPWSFYL